MKITVEVLKDGLKLGNVRIGKKQFVEDINWANEVLCMDAYEPLTLFKYELDYLEKRGESDFHDLPHVISFVNEFLRGQGCEFNMNKGQWERSFEKEQSIFLDFATAKIRNNEDMRPMSMNLETFNFMLFVEDYQTIERYNNLEDFITEEFYDFTHCRIDGGLIYDHIVNSDIFLYEVCDSEHSSNRLFVVRK